MRIDLLSVLDDGSCRDADVGAGRFSYSSAGNECGCLRPQIGGCSYAGMVLTPRRDPVRVERSAESAIYASYWLCVAFHSNSGDCKRHRVSGLRRRALWRGRNRKCLWLLQMLGVRSSSWSIEQKCVCKPTICTRRCMSARCLNPGRRCAALRRRGCRSEKLHGRIQGHRRQSSPSRMHSRW